MEWATLPNLQISVSIDGLQPEHDIRRAPATYQKILRNIEGQHATVHCTITSAMVKRDGYIDEFVDYWSANSNVEKIWMSIFTPQRGANDPEILSAEERRSVVEILLRLRESRPKLDMPAKVIREFLHRRNRPTAAFSRKPHVRFPPISKRLWCPASSAAIRIARNADALRPWEWPRWEITSWLAA